MSQPVDVASTTFADHTTLRVGGLVDEWLVARTEEACIEAVVECDDLSRTVLLVGGGSNLVCGDDHFAGTVIQVACPGVRLEERDGYIHAAAGAGEEWDEFVQRTMEFGSGFLAPLSGIPGLVGATPIQNVGAYGADVAQVIESVRVWDRVDRTVRDMAAENCGFSYRSSVFKAQPDRFVVLEVNFVLPMDADVVVGYRQLADVLGVEVGETASGVDVRHAVVALRRSKGMIIDNDDHDTWSVGSFFVNPIISTEAAAQLPRECPTYPADSGVKASAAWLIESCGIAPGYALPGSDARVSTKHTLALCNAGKATCDDVIELARSIRERVRERYAIDLQVEPRLVGTQI